MLDSSEAGTSRSPGALMPATRRAGIRLTSAASAPRSSRCASSGGSRSALRGSRMSGSRLTVASACS